MTTGTAAARFHTLAARGIAVTLDCAVGHIRSLVVTRQGRSVTPFHTAPWVDDPAIAADETLPANLRYLSGDFFCAPFAASDIEPAPPHGWSANSAWLLIDVTETDQGVSALYRLERRIMDAVLEKRLTLRHDHPFVYQSHVFTGGAGGVPVASHAMAAVRDGAILAFSAKESAETPATALEPDPARGRGALRYPARVTDPTLFPAANGGTVDLTVLPFAEAHEDVVMLVERAGSTLGWAAVSRPVQRDAMLSLKNPATFPVTVLWHSNGGRFYPPWNGRHIGVLGVEEARSAFLSGHRAALAPNDLSARGRATAVVLRPEGRVDVRHVIGAVPLPMNGAAIADISSGEDALMMHCSDGTTVSVPFDQAFLNNIDAP